MQLYRDSPQDVIDAIRTIEGRSDQCFDKLLIYEVPKGRASWGLLTWLVLRTEEERAAQGNKNYDAKLINLSQWGALALRWIQEKGSRAESELKRYSWTSSLADSVRESTSVATSYDAFLSCFPMWYNNRLLAELRSETTIRFMVPGGPFERRISAYHKGIRPCPYIQEEGLALTTDQERQRDDLLSRTLYAGDRAIAYPEPAALYDSLFPCYLDRLNAMVRRGDSIDLGLYKVEDLKRAYAALSTILSVHEDICFRYGNKYGYPADSCVMMRTPEDWAELLSRISGLQETRSFAIVDDLTLRDRFWDLHVQPLIPVDENMLAVAPQFPLHSRADENILRVCGHRRRSYFDEASRLKEQEMLDDLLPNCPTRFCPTGRIPLPNGLPDIDFLAAEEDSATLLLAELKWLRKPHGWRERLERDKDFDKGLRQLSDIKAFLAQHRSFLSDRGKLKRPIDEYANLAFFLVCRDHFAWPSVGDFVVADYEVFKRCLCKSDNLNNLIASLKSYEWLPVEGTDFEVRFDPAGVNGVTIEHEVFYRIS